MASSLGEFLALWDSSLAISHGVVVMCRSPIGCTSVAYRHAVWAKEMANDRNGVQCLERSFQSTGRACTTTPVQVGLSGKLLLAPAKKYF